MLISAKENLLVLHCLRCWDQHDEPVDNIIWFNTSSMIASIRSSRDEVPIQVSRFVFLSNFPTTAARLEYHLPEELHRFVTITKGPETP